MCFTRLRLVFFYISLEFSNVRRVLSQCNTRLRLLYLLNKQLLDEVFVISRIIKVEVGVISQSRRLRLISQKPNLIIVLLYIERMQKFESHVSTSSLTVTNTNSAKLT